MPGISVIRSLGSSGTRELCTLPVCEKRSYSSYQKCWENREHILPLIDFLDSYDSKLYFKRIETNIIDLYTNDRNFYDNAYANFEAQVIYRSEPKNLGIDENSDADIIVVKKYPHGTYKHKVFLLPHKMNGDMQEKTKFIKWLKSQSPRITCTDAITRWFLTTNWNWDRRYVLVEDEKTLLMLKLRCSEVIGRIYNYQISDK